MHYAVPGMRLKFGGRIFTPVVERNHARRNILKPAELHVVAPPFLYEGPAIGLQVEKQAMKSLLLPVPHPNLLRRKKDAEGQGT